MDFRYFRSRRSIRSFQKREIPDKMLNEILSLSAKAPTCGNMQLYSVIVTRDEERKKELSALHFNQAACSAPVLLTICADFFRFDRWCEINNAERGFNNFLSLTSAFADAMIYSQQLTTIAELFGLGTCFLGTVIYNAPQISKLLKLPSLTMPVACLTIGYPAEEGEPTERLSAEGFVYDEEYPCLTDKEITEIYRVKDEFPANKGYVEENGKENLAQVFAEVRYPKSMNEEFSEKLKIWLASQGWL